MTAWLGIFAMWLIACSPLISQSLRALAPDIAQTTVLCSASAADTTTASAVHHDRLAACGYCDLLASHAAMPALAPVDLVVVIILTTIGVCISRTADVPLGAFPSGRPRAPPLF